MTGIRNHRATGLPRMTADQIAEIRLRRFCSEPLASIEQAMKRPVRYYAYGGKTRAERIAADPTYLARHQASKRASGKRHYDPALHRERHHRFYAARKRVRDLSRWGLTEQQYEAMADQQGNWCAICSGENQRINARRLAVDHDHHSGRIRGLLCDCCNRAIGWLFDDADVLRRAAAYVEA